jgi:hypothetical protein
MNKLLVKISEAQNFVLNFSNRLKYVSSIITELYAKINSMEIELDDNEKQNLELVDEQIYSLEQLLNSKYLDHQLIIESFKDIQNKIS